MEEFAQGTPNPNNLPRAVASIRTGMVGVAEGRWSERLMRGIIVFSCASLLIPFFLFNAIISDGKGKRKLHFENNGSKITNHRVKKEGSKSPLDYGVALETPKSQSIDPTQVLEA